MQKTGTERKDLSGNKRNLFRLITLIFPLLLLLLLEGMLRTASYGDNLNLFIPNPRQGYEQYMMVNPSIERKYFRKFGSDMPSNDIFLKKKPEGTFRIFVMGSSTVVGFPYGDNLMFSRILHRQLEEACPDRHFEVINTAITAINSFSLADQAREISRYKPDAVLVYAGHNEFYGAFGAGSKEGMSKSRVITAIHLQLMDLRLYQLLRNFSLSILQKAGDREADRKQETLMKRIVAQKSISLESDEYHGAMKNYRKNMEVLINTFHKKDIPVFLSEVISNVKDLKPLGALSTGSENEALKTFNRASEAYRQGRYKDARKLFYKAKDMDGVRFRASEEINQIVHELSTRYNLPLVPMVSHFEERSPHGIIGNNLLTEHVHPNISGYFVMADAFYHKIFESGILAKTARQKIHSSDYHRINWGYTNLDTLRAHHWITILKSQWPFVPANMESHNYRSSYQPVSEADSVAFRSVSNKGPSLGELRLELARDYEERGNLVKAFGEYNALLHTNPYIAINYRDAASASIKLGDLPLALKYFSESLKWEPSLFAQSRIGDIYLIKGDYQSARDRYEKAFSMATGKDEKIEILGKLYMTCVYGGEENDAKAMKQQLQKYEASRYLKIPPQRYLYLNYIPFQTRNQIQEALQLISREKPEEGLLLLEKSLETYDSHVARRYIGQLCMQMGRYQEAQKQFQLVYDEFRFDPAFMTLYKELNKQLSQ